MIIYISISILVILYLISYLLYRLQIYKKIDLDIMETYDRENKYYNGVELIITNNKYKNIDNLSIKNVSFSIFDKNKIEKWVEIYNLIKDIDIENIIKIDDRGIDEIYNNIEKIDKSIISTFNDSYEDKRTLILEIKKSYHDMFIIIDSLLNIKMKFEKQNFPLNIPIFEKNHLGSVHIGITSKENFFYKDPTIHQILISYELNFNIYMMPCMMHLLIKSGFKKNKNIFFSCTKNNIKIKIIEMHLVNGIEVKKHTVKKHHRDYIFNMGLYKNWKFSLPETSLMLINKIENAYKSNKYYNALDLTTYEKNDIVFILSELKKIHDLKTISKCNELIEMIKDNNQLSIADKIYLRKNHNVDS